MTLNAVAVELLIDKGGFEPRVALGIAEAIETSMMQAQIVTVPILDARLQELKALLEIKIAELGTRIERTKSELVRWVFLVMLGNVALNVAAAAVLNALKH
jgi:hypothetical protein